MASEVHPSGEPRFQMLDAAMKRHRYQADALVEVLHTAQKLFGHIREDLLWYIARGLRQPPSRVFGVATFYHLFTFVPPANHSCIVCTGTACYVQGAPEVQNALEKELGIPAGLTRADGRASLQTARCLGTCGLAPAVVFDGTTVGYLDPEQATFQVKGWLGDGSR